MSSAKNRYNLNHVADDVDDTEIPKTQLVQREEPQVEGGREVPVPVEAGTNKARLLAEQRFKPVADKRATSFRLEPWIDDAVSQRVLQLKMEGYRKISREAVITDAIIQYLGLTPPKE